MPYNYGNYYQGNPYYNTALPTNTAYSGQYQNPGNYQTAVPLQNQQPSNNPGFVWVQGEAGAKAYPVAAGNSVLLMDSENPVLYMKSTDASGRPLPIEIYDLVKRQPHTQQMQMQTVQQPQIDLSGYVTKSDLDGILESKVQLLENKALGGE